MMATQLKTVLETLVAAHKKNSKLRVDLELTSGNVLERILLTDLQGDVLTLVMTEEKYFYSVNHVIGISSSYDDHQ